MRGRRPQSTANWREAVAAEEYAAIALADDEQHRHFAERIFFAGSAPQTSTAS